MRIDWAAIGTVFGVSLAATVVLVTLFALGTVGLARRDAARAGGSGTALLATGSYACFALCTAAVGYGIYLIAG